MLGNQVNWASLNGETLARLVTDKSVRRRVADLLNDSTPKGLVSFKGSGVSAVRDKAWADLADQAPLFYTATVRACIEKKIIFFKGHKRAVTRRRVNTHIHTSTWTLTFLSVQSCLKSCAAMHCGDVPARACI